jgi:PKD repeat protein
MKKNNGIWIVASLLTLSVFACKRDRIELKDLPEAAFSVSYVDSNNIKLISTSQGDPFLFNWSIDGLGNLSGKEVTANIVKKGKYKVLLTVYAQGGSDTVSGYVEIGRAHV